MNRTIITNPRRSMMSETTKTNIATMSASELEVHIAELEDKFRARIKTLRALARARQAEEEAAE
jgi:hypothetical protein